MGSEASSGELQTGGSTLLEIAVDHGQFIVISRDTEIVIETYTHEAQLVGAATWETGFAVFCDSHWTEATEVAVSLSANRPGVEVADVDRVIEAGIVCTTGELLIFGPEDTNVHEQEVRVAPGTYGVLICGADFDTADEYGDNGKDRYSLRLWPSTEAPPTRRLHP